jgi:hypothetical protein
LLVFLCTLYVCMYVVFVICIVDLKSSVELVFLCMLWYVSTLNKTLFIYLFTCCFAKIFDIIYKISSSPTATNLSLDAMVLVCWIKGSNYNWKHVRLTWEFPWDFLASGGPYDETLRLAVDPTNGKISRDSVLSNQIQDIYMSI